MTFKKLTEATKIKYTEADFAWDEKAMIAEYKAAVLDYMNGASMDDALKAIKAMLKSGGETIVKGKGPVRESKTAKITKSELKEMIREALREELASGDPLKETAMEEPEALRDPNFQVRKQEEERARKEQEELKKDTLKYFELWCKKQSQSDEPDDDPFGDDLFGTGSTNSNKSVVDYDKMLTLAKTILTNPDFRFTTHKDLDTTHAQGKKLLSSRKLLDAIEKSGGDKQKFLSWVNTTLSEADKAMFKKILP